VVRFALLLSIEIFAFASAFAQSAPQITRPPDLFFDLVREKYRPKAREFYKKHLNVEGMAVVSSGEVADAALIRTSEIVNRMLAGRPDILQAMVKNGMYLIIIGKDQVYTDMPEYSDHPNPAYQNERVRGTGGKPTSFGEENVLSLPIDRYDDESIAVHEFCHTIDSTLRSIDPTWSERRNWTYRRAIEKGLWKFSDAAGNPAEFWAEIAQSYFDCNRVNNWNHGPIGTREQLKAYDPESYELVRSTFNLSASTDWRYTWVQGLPNVTAPPAKFKIDPYYTKFSWAREFPVVGRAASEAALLKANDTIRKMFAYRHDLLKALINDGVRLVVLGKDERISDLPEASVRSPAFKRHEAEPPKGGTPNDNQNADLLARFLEYHPELKLIVVAEQNVLANPAEPLSGDNQIIRLLAKAFYDLCAQRPVDPNWDQRGRDVQQYELRVTRLDTRFKDELQGLFEAARAKNLWKGSGAMNGPSEYWARGVLAYFDAAGQVHAPEAAERPISTREQLRDYDAALYELVRKTMAYEGHVDWRFTPAK
jgi:hypothetical protein